MSTLILQVHLGKLVGFLVIVGIIVAIVSVVAILVRVLTHADGFIRLLRKNDRANILMCLKMSVAHSYSIQRIYV